MPVITAAIDPVSRIEGHLKIEVKVDTVNGVQQIVDAHSAGTLFRGFEKILEGRDPRDAPLITSRICGVCPTSHAQAAGMTLDKAIGITAPTAGRILRNLVHGACFLESHILHFYLLSAPDYVSGPGMAPWTPGWDVGKRIDKNVAATLLNHYLMATAIRRQCHEMAAIFGGRLPIPPTYIAGGFTTIAKADDKTAFQNYLTGITAFIADQFIPDAELLASIFNDYFSIGRGYGNLLAYGAFELNDAGTSKLFQMGRVPNGSDTSLPLDTNAITESVTHAWYDESTNNLSPASGNTLAQFPKDGAYSWLKAPRYDTGPYEVGALARMIINREYPHGISVMDRHLARARETLKIAQAMQDWLNELPLDTPAYTHATVPDSASAMGLTEAPRGALGHWLNIANGKIAHYQIITPTCWNCSPRDTAGQRGPVEEALIGTPIANADEPIEALRVIHSFDPCLDCATHVIRVGSTAPVFALGGLPGRIVSGGQPTDR